MAHTETAKFIARLVGPVLAVLGVAMLANADTYRTLIEEFLKVRLANPPPLEAFLRIVVARHESDTLGRLKDIRVPTLVLVGEEDPPTPPALARGLHEAIAGSRLEVIPGAGHFSNQRNPRIFISCHRASG